MHTYGVTFAYNQKSNPTFELIAKVQGKSMKIIEVNFNFYTYIKYTFKTLAYTCYWMKVRRSRNWFNKSNNDEH